MVIDRPVYYWEVFSMFYTIAKLIGRVLFTLTGGIRISGKERLPEKGPLIIVCNHQSIIDPLVLLTFLPYRITFLAAAYLFKIPLVGLILRAAGAMPIHSAKGDFKSLKESIKLLEKGGVLGIFPEGGVSLDGKLRPFMSGASYIALKSGTAILPVALGGTRDVLPVGTYFPRRKRITINIGQTIMVERKDKIKRDDMTELDLKLKEELQKLMDLI